MIPGSILRRIARARILSSYNAIHFEHEIPDETVRRPWDAAPREDCPFRNFQGLPVRAHDPRARACRTLWRSHVRLLETPRVIQEDACLRESIVRLPSPPPPSLLLVLSVSTPRPVRVSPFAYTILPVLNAKRHSKLGTLAVPSERASTPRAIAFTCLTLPSPILAVSAPRISTDRINVGLVGDKTPD